MTASAAIAGCGRVGRKRAEALETLGVNVATVFGTDPDNAEELAQRLPGRVLVAGSAEEAFSHKNVDFAVVATTHAALAPVAMAAIENGCDVLVEKPGATSLNKLIQLAEAAKSHSRTVRVGLNHRVHPAITKAKELIDADDLGEIMHLRARYGHGGRVGYEKEWRANRELSGGGELMDQGMHLIDLARLFLGDVELAFSELRTDYWNMDVEDNAFLVLRSTQGALAWLHASWTEWKNLFSLEIALEQAKIEVLGLGGSYGTERLTLHRMLPEMGPPLTSAWEWPRPDESWLAELKDVLDGLSGRPYRGADLDDCIAAFRIVERAYEK